MKLLKIIALFFVSLFITTCAFAQNNLGDNSMNSQKAFEHLKSTDSIKTKRLTLSKQTDEDLETLAEYYMDEEVHRGFPLGRILNTEKNITIARWKNLGENVLHFTIRNQENTIVGCAICIFVLKENMMEIGGWIAKPFWGNEYIEEAGFAVWLKLCEVSTDFTAYLSAANFNEKSQKAIEKGLKLLDKMGINYSVEKHFVNSLVEVVPIENNENVSVKRFENGIEISQTTCPKNFVKWHVLTDNKLEIKDVCYKITTSKKEINS